jgi:long-chain acyl-CoA synthetase
MTMTEVSSGARRIPTEDLVTRIAKAAAAFRSLGVGAGDGIALFLRNDLAFLEASVAAGKLGAYPIPVNWHFAPDEARYVLEDSGAKVIVVHADFHDRLQSAIPPGVAVIIVETPPEIRAAYAIADAACATPPGLRIWDAWIEGFEPLSAAATEPPAAIIYTSGTTGRPKGVRRQPPTAQQYEFVTGVMKRVFGLGDDPSRIVTAITGPMYHSAPYAYGVAAVNLGARVILMPRFDAEGLLQLIERERVTHLHMVPVMFNRLLQLPIEIRQRYDLSSLRHVVHAAAPCPPTVKCAMIDWWGPIIHEYYGGTESFIVVYCTSADWLAHPGTVGRPIDGAEVRVIDAQGANLPTGEIGEIVCRLRGCPDFTYQNDPAKRREAEKGGLYALGDVGYFDNDGFLHLSDRAKDMIISGGANIYPAEIEAALVNAPGVADCAVFGIPDAEYGESVHAVVLPQPGAMPTLAELQTFLRTRIAGFKIPRTMELKAEVPREDSGKIFKRKLRAPYWEGHDKLI